MVPVAVADLVKKVVNCVEKKKNLPVHKSQGIQRS